MKPKLTLTQARVLELLKMGHLLSYLHPYIFDRSGHPISMWPNSRPIINNQRILAKTFHALDRREWIKVKFVGLYDVYFYTITPAGIAAVKEGK